METLRQNVESIVQRDTAGDDAYVHASGLLERADLSGLPVFRLAVLRSFTIEPLAEVLRVKFFLEGLRLELFLNKFNQYEQEILDPSSRLYRFKPDMVFMAVRLEELCPVWMHDFADLEPGQIRDLRQGVFDQVSGWIERLKKQEVRNTLISNFLVPANPVQGLYDTQVTRGQIWAIRSLNRGLVRIAERYPQANLFDLEHLAGREGKRFFCDARQGYRMSNPYRLSAYIPYGEYLLAHVKALLGRRKKCLVLDLDDTLWGGVVGEDGPSGLKLSDAYPGNTYKDFQKAVLELSRRGVLLAINSKNNTEEAMAVIRSHPDMVLREEHFSALRINWKDKAENLIEIAHELNLGLDAFVFMDDSPAECDRIRQACPEVKVVQLPRDRHRYRGTLESLNCFEALSITEEDRRRGRVYCAQTERFKAASQASSLEDFYARLRMRGTLSCNDRSLIPRIAQMTQKTNQFNLTTRRYTDSDIERFMERGRVYALGVEDQYGDNGIVATAVVETRSRDGGDWIIDSFLMSCRVVMRTVEDTLLSAIARDARISEVSKLIGLFIPSASNRMVRDFYRDRGFEGDARDGEETKYVFDLVHRDGPHPSPWIRMESYSDTLERMNQT